MSDIADMSTLLAGTTSFEKMTFYDGAVTLIYEPGIHAYYVEEEGVRYLVPGATTVCGMIDKSGPLTGWAARSTVEYVRQALVRWECPTDHGEGQEILDLSAVTTVEELDVLLLKAKANYRNISQSAKDTGHLAHEWLELRNVALVQGLQYNAPRPDDEKASRAIDAALDWQEKHNFRPLFAEQKIYSRELGVAGTFDWVALVDSCPSRDCCPHDFKDKMTLGDYKSSRAIYDEYRIQTALYKRAWEEEKGAGTIELRVVLRLGKDDGEFEPMVLFSDEDYQSDMAAFEGALAIYNWMKQIQLDRRAEKQKEKVMARLLKPPTNRRRVKVPLALEVGEIPMAAA